MSERSKVLKEQDYPPMESVGGVPEMLYESFKAIKNPRRFAIFDYLCKSKRGVTTKELELSLHESINIVDDTLREFEHLNLAKFEGRAAAPANTSIKAGDWEGKFKTYSITEHGHNLYKLCRAYNSEKPLSNLSGSLDPKDVVEGFAKMKKEELNLMLNKFRDMYLLGALLVSLSYQTGQTATSRWLGNSLRYGLETDEVEKLLREYSGPEGLVTTSRTKPRRIDRVLVSLVSPFVGQRRVKQWLSRVSYSLAPEGRKIAQSLSKQFAPEDLGVDEEYIHPEYVEAERGTLRDAIRYRCVALTIAVGLGAFAWLDIIYHLTNNVFVLLADAFLVPATILFVIFRVPPLVTRLRYWRRLQHHQPTK